ncbi:MAG TPA: carboxypeptidase regulatory-like domain-containing protein [Dehalococcoidia bacterium]|nr:carboxypeptidase regulatory-like domain-containing protein [Dehalococcoidia bacterium]
MSITLIAGQTTLNVTVTPVYVPPQTATLYGVVTDADTGHPIESVKVEVRAPAFGGDLIIKSGYTDASGYYEITDIDLEANYLPPNAVLFTHDEYESKTVPVAFEPGVIELNTTLSPIVQKQTAVLQGLVTDADTGSPIVGVLVEVLGTGLSTYTISKISMLEGNYKITDIPVGTYTIRFSHIDYETLEV